MRDKRLLHRVRGAAEGRQQVRGRGGSLAQLQPLGQGVGLVAEQRHPARGRFVGHSLRRLLGVCVGCAPSQRIKALAERHQIGLAQLSPVAGVKPG